MKKELDERLIKAFPNLYRQRGDDMRVTAMCWGFEIGDGWFDIIWSLSEKLEDEILKIPEPERKSVCASQVKEKYGTLRFHMTRETDEMSKLIGEACQKTHTTCEDCGQQGKVRDPDGWVTVRCNDCYNPGPAAA